MCHIFVKSIEYTDYDTRVPRKKTLRIIFSEQSAQKQLHSNKRLLRIKNRRGLMYLSKNFYYERTEKRYIKFTHYFTSIIVDNRQTSQSILYDVLTEQDYNCFILLIINVYL